MVCAGLFYFSHGPRSVRLLPTHTTSEQVSNITYNIFEHNNIIAQPDEYRNHHNIYRRT